MFHNIVGRILTILFFGLVILFQPARAANTDIVNATPALWQVSVGKGNVYLLGSFHILPENYHWYDGIIRKTFEGADELVLEAEITPEATAGLQALMIKNGFFGDNDSLKNHLDEAHYVKLLAYSKKLMGLDEAMTAKSKPWFIAIQLSILSMMSHGMDPDSGVDKYIEDKAEQAKKPVSGLETAEDGMKALIDHPLSVQSAMLSDTLDKLDDFESYINDYLAAWASGDADRMANSMIKDMAEQKELYQAMLVDRNIKWLPAIEDHIKSGRTIFIVVGAAHLAGPDSIIKMLSDKGYRVDKIQ